MRRISIQVTVESMGTVDEKISYLAWMKLAFLFFIIKQIFFIYLASLELLISNLALPSPPSKLIKIDLSGFY